MAEINFNDLVSNNDFFVRKGKSYSHNDWYVTIRLSDFLNSREERMENDEGETELGIFIPYAHNGITVTSRNNVQCTFRASLAERATNRYTHILRQVMDSVDYEYRKDLGYNVPIIGHMRPVNFKEK